MTTEATSDEVIFESGPYSLRAGGGVFETATGREVADLSRGNTWETDPSIPAEHDDEFQELAGVFSHYKTHGIIGFPVDADDPEDGDDAPEAA